MAKPTYRRSLLRLPSLRLLTRIPPGGSGGGFSTGAGVHGRDMNA
jgi:hypothetical protein